ncbi:electron transfer flavoprotein subunit beta/FixA family protein [Leucobacter sp. USHLN153]|uniref:electron transfer flavoprotein subunit beta/FixA family protein n=1 Tax=Leucobacter sp. USHLN153 TaxID=3081268 RepID=UPI00301707F9
MKIYVLVKEVPDTYGERALDLETGLAVRDGDTVLDEICERALEAALNIAEQHEGTEVVALSMASEAATASVRKALAIGADSAVHIVDERLAGADLGLTAETLVAAIRRGAPDLVLAGNVSTDGAGGMIPAMLAEHLSVVHATSLSSVEVEEGRVSGMRVTEDGAQTLSAQLPAVVSITDALPEARFPNFKSIMAAKKKPVEVLSLEDLGVSVDASAVPYAVMTSVSQKPPRKAGVKLVDEGDAVSQLVEFLEQNRLV